MNNQFIRLSSAIFVWSALSTSAYAKCSFSVTGTRSHHRSAISYPSNCEGEAKAAIQERLESILNVDYVAQSFSKDKMETLAGQYAEGIYSGSYSRGQDNSGSSFVKMGDIRWIVTVDSCNVQSWSAAEGEDRGWGQGRANNGHCSADVKCSWRFTTYDFDCPRSSVDLQNHNALINHPKYEQIAALLESGIIESNCASLNK